MTVPFTEIGKTGEEYLKVNLRHSNSNFKMAAESTNRIHQRGEGEIYLLGSHCYIDI